MARINTPRPHVVHRTHEGAVATNTDSLHELRRSVLSCMLFEDTFYESGQVISERILNLCNSVNPEKIAALAIEARNEQHLRQVPLLLLVGLLNHPQRIQYLNFVDTCDKVIQRPDEAMELLALYWKHGDKDAPLVKRPIAAQLKKGIAKALRKFGTYSIAKYRGDKSQITLRDIVRLIHPIPKNNEQSETFSALTKNTLRSEDTWEVELSASKGENKKVIWEKLLVEERLGGLALLRNLRNFSQDGVNRALVVDALKTNTFKHVLPFRFITAARMAPDFEPELEAAFLRVMAKQTRLPDHTTVLVDVSGSMDGATVSGRSQVTRTDAACGIAMILREMTENCSIFTFSNALVQCPPRHGFALRDAIVHSQDHGGTYLGGALDTLYSYMSDLGKKLHRLVVITDEQSHDAIPSLAHGYCVNVAPYQHGVTYTGNWIRVDGFSDSVVKYMCAIEGISGDPQIEEDVDNWR